MVHLSECYRSDSGDRRHWTVPRRSSAVGREWNVDSRSGSDIESHGSVSRNSLSGADNGKSCSSIGAHLNSCRKEAITVRINRETHRRDIIDACRRDESHIQVQL